MVQVLNMKRGDTAPPFRARCDGLRNVTVSRTAASTAVTGTSGTFESWDVGRPVTGPGIPDGAKIATVTSSTAAALSIAATTTTSGLAAIGPGPINLANGVSGVRFLMKRAGSTVLTGTMVIEDQTANPGWVHRAWGSTDLATEGTYSAEVEVTWSDGTIQTYPADEYAYVRVLGDLG